MKINTQENFVLTFAFVFFFFFSWAIDSRDREIGSKHQ